VGSARHFNDACVREAAGLTVHDFSMNVLYSTVRIHGQDPRPD